jgi:hypothetical protein
MELLKSKPDRYGTVNDALLRAKHDFLPIFALITSNLPPDGLTNINTYFRDAEMFRNHPEADTTTIMAGAA